MSKFTSNTTDEQRNYVANRISDVFIHRSVVDKVVNLDCLIEEKADILFDAVPDLSIIMSQLSICKSEGKISPEDYTILFNRCLLKLNTKNKPIKFNPLFMNRKEDP